VRSLENEGGGPAKSTMARILGGQVYPDLAIIARIQSTLNIDLIAGLHDHVTALLSEQATPVDPAGP
jgi:hypothetical protein